MRLALVGVAALAVAILVAGCGGGNGGSSTAQTTVGVLTVTRTVTAPGETKTVTARAEPTSSAITVASDSQFAPFRTPSGNIGCVAQIREGNAVRCDIDAREWKPPQKPAACDYGWGNSLELEATGRARFACTSDTYVNSGLSLPYGSTVKVAAIVCTVRASGVRCSNSQGHGFFLSRQRVDVF